MVKHWQVKFSVLLISIVLEAFATKRKKMYIFFITCVCKFFSYVVVFSHCFVAIMESN